MSKSNDYSQYTSLLDPDGPIALIIKQDLAPDDEDERLIFPPTYPLTTFKGRVQRFEHGEYRVSIELPPDTKRDKDERRDSQKAGYQIDRFPDGTNVCEIDSIQSQSNRIEPQFKTIKSGSLVPKVTIKVKEQTVNLLDAGHRAADAIVRMSSLAKEFHDAWMAAKAGDLYPLARLAPTAIVFGAWDSRSTQAKLQRMIKAHIRATNVLERTRSAQYTPAIDYTATGAIDASISVGEDDKNNLSQEGMKHALSTQTAGGVALTEKSKLTRTVNINLAAIRQLRASGVKVPVPNDASEDQKAKARDREQKSASERTTALQQYILGLSLVAAFTRPNLNLREGCNLQARGELRVSLVQDLRKTEQVVEPSKIDDVAEWAAKNFFGDEFATKEKEGEFASDVAEEFLSMSTADRDKVRAMGPITAETLRRFAEQGNDPLKSLGEAIKAVKNALGKKPTGKKAAPVKNPEALQPLVAALTSMSTNASLDDDVRQFAERLLPEASEHDDSHAALKKIGDAVKAFKQTKKDAADIAGVGASEETEGLQ